MSDCARSCVAPANTADRVAAAINPLRVQLAILLSSHDGVFPVRAQQAPNGRAFVFPLDPSSCLLVEQVYGSRIKPEGHKIAAAYLLACVALEAYRRALRFRRERGRASCRGRGCQY